MDIYARVFLHAAKLVEDGELTAEIARRYAGWQKPDARAMLDGSLSMEEIARMDPGSESESSAEIRPPGIVGEFVEPQPLLRGTRACRECCVQ